MDDREQTNLFELKLSNGKHETAYLRLPTRLKNEKTKVSRMLRLHDLIGAYEGPDINLDFDQYGVLIGIEILADVDEEDEEDME